MSSVSFVQRGQLIFVWGYPNNTKSYTIDIATATLAFFYDYSVVECATTPTTYYMPPNWYLSCLQYSHTDNLAILV